MESDYRDALDTEGRDLVAAARSGVLARPRFRDAELDRVVELLQAGRSVLLLGPDGVGKTAVVHGLAHRYAQGQPARGLVEMSTSVVMAGTRYLGEWQTKVRAIVDQAATRQAVLYLSDVWNLPSAGRTSNSDSNALDAIRPDLEQRRLAVVAEATPEILRQMERVPRFAALFERVEVGPLAEAQVDALLDEATRERSLSLAPDARRALVSLTGRFLPARPQPGPALELLRQVAERASALPQGAPVAADFVERTFAEHTGLPVFIVQQQAAVKASALREAFRAHLVGQEDAVDAVIEAIALFKAGLQDPGRPLGTFLFVGPTGVGKTELARTLAQVLFGSPDRLLRFDLGEYKDFHSFELLLGNPRDPARPAALVDPVRANPFQVILFDELEKAHENVWDVLLGLLDEGRLTPPAGETVDFRSTFVICTSNVGAEGSDKRLGFGEAPDLSARQAAVLKGLERHFRPELLNRFGRIVVFHPLSRDQVRSVARQELARVLRRDGITSRELVVDVDDEALDLVIDQGYDERYGARALKRQLQAQVVVPLAMEIMEAAPRRGQLVRVDAQGGRLRIRVLETPTSRAEQREQRPVKVEGQRLGRAELAVRVQAARQAAEALAEACNAPGLRQERDRLLALRREPDFWKSPRDAARDLRDLDLADRDLGRLDRLAERCEECSQALASAVGRAELHHLAERLLTLEQHLADARRELVVLGRAGLWDALVEIRPVGATGPQARDLLARTYARWGSAHGHGVEWLCEPGDADEACLLAVRGPYASGLLAREAGLHRLRHEDGASVCRVRVGPWLDVDEEPVWGASTALRRTGALGHRIRSRIEVGWPGQGRRAPLVLQGDRTIDAAREVAREVLGSWTRLPAASDRRVRRYDAASGQCKDHLLGVLTLHPDRIAPARFHQLLCDRLEPS